MARSGGAGAGLARLVQLRQRALLRLPVHEDVPGELLVRVPIADLVTTLTDPRVQERHDAGAVRHRVSWRTRPHQRREVAGLPEPLRARMLAHARRSGDSDKQGRAEEWSAPRGPETRRNVHRPMKAARSETGRGHGRMGCSSRRATESLPHQSRDRPGCSAALVELMP